MKKTTVIGDGGWGTALALVLNENGHDVTVWGPFPEYIKSIQETGENKSFLPEIQIPSSIKWTADREESVKDADVAVIATPTRYYRETLESFSSFIPESCQLVSVAKGLDQESHKRMTEVAEEILPGRPVSALSGPSHAEEVARNIPTAVTIASDNHDDAVELQKIFSNERFRVYTSDDVAGTELGGTLKNVIAIAVGISDGMGFGDNTRAALITRGLSEMTKLGCALGAKESTFAGLTGMGDLIVTCTSKLSRNRSIGERLGKGESIDEILSNMTQAAEGIWNCKSAHELAQAHNIEAPITREVHAIVHERKDPRDAVKDLLARDVKPE